MFRLNNVNAGYSITHNGNTRKLTAYEASENINVMEHIDLQEYRLEKEIKWEPNSVEKQICHISWLLHLIRDKHNIAQIQDKHTIAKKSNRLKRNTNKIDFKHFPLAIARRLLHYCTHIK